MQVIERSDAADTRDGGAAEGAELSPLQGPRLSDEQREWLNTVFIPNFRAELMRELDMKGALRRQEKTADAGSVGIDKPEVCQAAAGARAPALQPDPEEGGEEKKPEESDHGARQVEDTCLEKPSVSQASGSAQRVTELEGEMTRLRAALAETRIEQELVWAAAAQHAINPAQVAQLLKDRVRLDANLDPMVVDANGDHTHDGYGNPITVAEAVKAFLDENPHMVQPSSELTGGGSGGTDATARAHRVAAVTGGDLIEEALREGE